MTNRVDFQPKQRPHNVKLTGRHVTLMSIKWEEHGQSLAQNIARAGTENLWTYIPFGPFTDAQGLQNVMTYVAGQFDWEVLAIVSNTNGEVLGTASYMRLRPEQGSVETGCIVFGSVLQKTISATEAMYLMARHIFDDLGYRRYEWKCDNRNKASKAAALRLGFSYEGLFRQDRVVKQKNRDTAWFSIIDTEWPNIKTGFETWLAPENFSKQGAQVKSLRQCREI